MIVSPATQAGETLFQGESRLSQRFGRGVKLAVAIAIVLVRHRLLGRLVVFQGCILLGSGRRFVPSRLDGLHPLGGVQNGGFCFHDFHTLLVCSN